MTQEKVTMQVTGKKDNDASDTRKDNDVSNASKRNGTRDTRKGNDTSEASQNTMQAMQSIAPSKV